MGASWLALPPVLATEVMNAPRSGGCRVTVGGIGTSTSSKGQQPDPSLSPAPRTGLIMYTELPSYFILAVHVWLVSLDI